MIEVNTERQELLDELLRGEESCRYTAGTLFNFAQMLCERAEKYKVLEHNFRASIIRLKGLRDDANFAEARMDAITLTQERARLCEGVDYVLPESCFKQTQVKHENGDFMHTVDKTRAMDITQGEATDGEVMRRWRARKADLKRLKELMEDAMVELVSNSPPSHSCTSGEYDEPQEHEHHEKSREDPQE